uniref:Longitudinals lacking protein, isoforms A/B/D/L n=1 Tax=Lygus hesperus TaxID=30085 RepID=A0A0A9VYY6_LYGHE
MRLFVISSSNAVENLNSSAKSALGNSSGAKASNSMLPHDTVFSELDVLSFRGLVRFFQCSSCARKYKSKQALARHKKYECGVEPQFMCHVCLKRFSRSDSLKAHMFHLHSINANQP